MVRYVQSPMKVAFPNPYLRVIHMSCDGLSFGILDTNNTPFVLECVFEVVIHMWTGNEYVPRVWFAKSEMFATRLVTVGYHEMFEFPFVHPTLQCWHGDVSCLRYLCGCEICVLGICHVGRLLSFNVVSSIPQGGCQNQDLDFRDPRPPVTQSEARRRVGRHCEVFTKWDRAHQKKANTNCWTKSGQNSRGH